MTHPWTWHPGAPPPLRLLEPDEVLRVLEELREIEELYRMALRIYYARDGRDA